MKTSLVLCLAVVITANSAQAQFTALDENELRATTGQAGITIEVQADLSKEEVEWHDTGALLLTGSSVEANSPDIQSSLNQSFSNSQSSFFEQFSQSYQNAQGGLSNQFNESTQMLYGGNAWSGEQSMTTSPTLNTGSQVGTMNLSPNQSHLDNDNFGLYAASGAAIFMSDFNMDVLGIGDLLVNEGTQSLELNAFFTARNETLSSKNAPISRDLFIHDSRGEHTEIRGDQSLAFMKMTISMASTPEGKGAVFFDLHSFDADIDLTNIAFGSGASIGSLYLTDIHGASNVAVYGH